MTEEQQATTTGRPASPSPEQVYKALFDLYRAVMMVNEYHEDHIAARNQACRVIRAVEGQRA